MLRWELVWVLCKDEYECSIQDVLMNPSYQDILSTATYAAFVNYWYRLCNQRQKYPKIRALVV